MLAMFLYTGYRRLEEPGRTMMEGWLRTRRLSSNPICPAVLWTYGRFTGNYLQQENLPA